MKNFKLLGIIALVAVIGFSMAACGGDDDNDTATFRIKNESANTINYVRIFLYDVVEGEYKDDAILEDANANIASNTEKSFSFTVNYDPERLKCAVEVGTDSSNIQRVSYKTMKAGDTQVVVINSSGNADFL